MLLSQKSNSLICLLLVSSFSLLLHLEAAPKKEKTSSSTTPVAGPSQPPSPQTIYLTTIGTLAAQGLYLTYTSIGALADGFSSQAYDKETAQSIMNGYVNLSKICRDQLGLLIAEGKLSPEDKKLIREIEMTYSHLINQGQSFLDYLESGDTTYLSTFDDNRKIAWSRIVKILQIPE